MCVSDASIHHINSMAKERLQEEEEDVWQQLREDLISSWFTEDISYLRFKTTLSLEVGWL